eukprot:10736097-Alexandrium_andersonii.AAC.1
MAWRGWPERWRRLVRAFETPRWAVYVKPDGTRVRGQLMTGIGMGGPIKPFLWALGFDPVIFSVEGLTGRPTPTYVDDVAIT